MAERTPGPWGARSRYVETEQRYPVAEAFCGIPPGKPVEPADLRRANANAEFIARACNLHDRLVDVLEHAEEAGNAAILLRTSDHSVGTWFLDEMLPEVIEALAELRGEAVAS